MTFRNLQIDAAELPRTADIDWLPLDPRHAVANGLIAAAVPVILSSIGAVIAAANGRLEGRVWALAGGIVLLSGVFGAISYISTRVRRYAIREHDAAFARGLVFRRKTFVAYNRVQHVEVSRGPVDRSIGLATLKFFTAGGTGADLSVPGLQVETAEALREQVVAITDDND